jgi:hypothetical protein
MMESSCTVASLIPLDLLPAPKLSRLPPFQVHQSKFVRQSTNGQSISFVFGRVAASMLHQPRHSFLAQIPTPLNVQSISERLPRLLQTYRIAAHGPNRSVERGPSAFLATVTLIESVSSQIQPRYANRSRLVPGKVAERSPSQGGRSLLPYTCFEFSFISFFRPSSSSPRVS